MRSHTNSQLTTTLTPTNSINNNDTWNLIAKALETMVSTDAFNRWFKNATCEAITETEVLISVPDDIHQVWIETNFMPELQTAVSTVLDPTVIAKITIAGQVTLPENETKTTKHSPTVSTQKAKNAGLNPQFTFDRFVVGHNSEFAHAACTAVANGSKFAYNPLFIHGSPGLGKTHLLHAIGNEVLAANPNAKILYLTSEKFTNEFIDAVKKASLDKFRKKYRRADLLLIDDIQFLAGKERTEEEFFHTFNTLLDLQSQIVITSDRPACEIKKFDSRMVSRFESGLAVELQVPMMETRMAILKRKMDEWDTQIPLEILHFLAEKIRSNVRRLEGALIRVATFSSLGSGSSLSIEKVENLLRDILREEGARKVTINSIQKTVSEHFDIRLADMSSRRRPANIAFARQCAMYLSRKLTRSSLMEIGEAFGGRDHGTVIHAVKKVEQRMGKESSVKDTIELLDAMLQRK